MHNINGILIRIAVFVIGYFFGMIQTAYIYGKCHGIDIREHGSGNAGTTNTLRVLGKKAGLVVFIGDLLKTLIPILLVGIWWSHVNKEATDTLWIGFGQVLKLYAGLGAIIGHNFPFYLGFKGGKGIAASGGLMIGYHWSFIIVGFFTFFGTFSLTNYVSLGSLMLLGGFFVQNCIMVLAKLGPMGVDFCTTSTGIEILILSFFISALAFIRHHENIKRLINHNERKTYIFKSNKNNN